jgi:hypothetical protein
VAFPRDQAAYLQLTLKLDGKGAAAAASVPQAEPVA